MSELKKTKRNRIMEGKSTLSDEQLDAINRARRGETFVICGGAGTGKTEIGRRILAAWGDSALALSYKRNSARQFRGGKTIYAFLGLHPGDSEIPAAFARKLFTFLNSRLGRSTRKSAVNATALLLDEFGFVSALLFSQLDALFRYFRNKYNVPFGGLQVIAMGDLEQLQTIKGVPCYQCINWLDTFGSRRVELVRVFRQTDPSFAELVNRVRTNCVTSDDIQRLESRRKEFHLAFASGMLPPDTLFLVPTRRLVEEYTKNMYSNLDGPERTYKRIVSVSPRFGR